MIVAAAAEVLVHVDSECASYATGAIIADEDDGSRRWKLLVNVANASRQADPTSPAPPQQYVAYEADQSIYTLLVDITEDEGEQRPKKASGASEIAALPSRKARNAAKMLTKRFTAFADTLAPPAFCDVDTPRAYDVFWARGGYVGPWHDDGPAFMNNAASDIPRVRVSTRAPSLGGVCVLHG